MSFSENTIAPSTQSGIPPIDFKAELNDDQYAAVTAADGPALVLAGAGSGKTRTLTYRVAYLLSQGVWPSEILLLTFTNKAAKEMLDRVEELTGIQPHKFWGGTFHSLGQRFLRMHGESLGLDKNYTILDQGDAEALMKDSILEVEPTFNKKKENPKPRVVADMISYARNTRQGITETIIEKYPWHHDIKKSIQNFAANYKERKRKQQVCDYDDLLELWLELLKKEEELTQHYASRFKYILVDEYQDTNQLQSEIIDTLARNHQIMAVGDDAQCIYTWRGAQIENIVEFPDRHPGTQIFKIEINYRSTPEILNFANNVLENQAKIGFEKTLKAHNPGHQKPIILPAMDTQQQAWFVIKRIQALQDEGYFLKDMAVLYRAHFQAMDLQMELSRSGIPFTITSGVRFFEQAHVRDIVAQLRFTNNPTDSSAFGRVVTLLPRVGGKTAERLFKQIHKLAEKEKKSPIRCMGDKAVVAKVPKDAKAQWEDLALTLKDIEDAMGGPLTSSVNPQEKQDELFGNDHAPAPIVRKEDALSPRAILEIAIDGWYGEYLRGAFENWRSRKDDLDSMLAFGERFDNIAEMLAQLVLLNSETSDKSIDPELDTVKLTTVHQAKGLEYPIVFVIGAADELFPLKRAMESGDIEEERRLFYVAVTRAKKELYLLFPRIVTTGGPPRQLQPSQFLRETTDEFYEVIRPESSRGY